MVSSPSDANESETGTSDRPNSFGWHVSRVVDRFDDLLMFALVPLLTALLNAGNVRQTLSQNRGFSINLEFALPSALLDLWSLATPPEPAPVTGTDSVYGPPTGGPTDDPTGTGSPTGFEEQTGPGGTDLTVETPFGIVADSLESMGLAIVPGIVIGALVYAVLLAVLQAVYVGGIDRRLENNRIEPVACILRYAPRLVLYNLVILGATVLLIPVLLVSPILFILVLPAGFVLSYLFYAVPFLFVVDDARFLEAFSRSLEFAIGKGSYFWFAVWHVVAAVVASFVLSILVSIGGPIGLLLAVGFATPIALVLTATTVSFLRELLELEGKSQWAT